MYAVPAWRSAIVALALLSATSAAVSAQARPAGELPFVPVDTYPPASRGEIDEAYRHALAHPDDAPAVGALAMLLQSWTQFEAATAVYARAQALAPNAVDWWYLGGLTADALARRADAVSQFERAAALAPGTPVVSLRLADARLASGDAEGAGALYRVLVSSPDCAAAAWYGLGRVSLAQNDDAQARAAFEKALTLYPDFGAAHYAMAGILRRAKDSDGARLSLLRQRQCQACWPTPHDPWQERVALLRSDAATLLTQGIAQASAGTASANAEAIRLHEAALASELTRGQAHVNLIELYGRTGNVGAAHEHYLAALEAPGFVADAHRAYGLVLLAQQKADDALAVLRQAAAVAPRDATVLQGMGLAFEMLDQPDAAVDAYNDALRAAPGRRDARFGLARIAMRRQQTDEAIAHLEELREPRDAESSRYLFALSVAYVRRGRVDDARRVAHEALDVARRFGDTRRATAIEAELRKLTRTP